MLLVLPVTYIAHDIGSLMEFNTALYCFFEKYKYCMERYIEHISACVV